MPIRVLIADDHAAVRDAFAYLIEVTEELELAASAADADEAVELASREQPDVALVDVRMPGGGGFAAARGIAASSPRTAIIALSASATDLEALEPHFAGHILKGGSNSDIIDLVKRVAVGQAFPSTSQTAPRTR